MEPETQSPDMEAEVLALIATLPKPVQEFLLGEERTKVILELTQKYNLHVDQGAIFERAFMMMMLGVDTPKEFSDSLSAGGINPATISGLINDINAQVFIPLREKEREEEEVPVIPPQPSPRREAAPPPSYTPPTPPPAPTFPLYDMGSENTREVTPPIPTYNTGTPISTPTPVAQAVASVPPPQTPIPQTPTLTAEERPLMRTFASDVEQLKHGETPHAYAQGSAPHFAPAPVATPMPSLTERPVVPPPPITPTPTSVAPVATPTFVMPPQTPIERPRTPTPTKEEVTHSLKQYGIDPYREPVE